MKYDLIVDNVFIDEYDDYLEALAEAKIGLKNGARTITIRVVGGISKWKMNK